MRRVRNDARAAQRQFQTSVAVVVVRDMTLAASALRIKQKRTGVCTTWTPPERRNAINIHGLGDPSSPAYTSPATTASTSECCERVGIVRSTRNPATGQ